MIKHYNVYTINFRIKLAVLYVLNLLDMIMTNIYLSTGDFYEINPIMRQAYNKPAAFILIKTIIPALLIFYLIIRINKIKPRQIKAANIIINLILGVYLLVNVVHFYNLIFYLNKML